MRNASKDDIIADVRARLSLMEGHAAVAGPNDAPIAVFRDELRMPADESGGPMRESRRPLAAAAIRLQIADPAAVEPEPADPSLDALYASIAAVYASTTGANSWTSKPHRRNRPASTPVEMPLGRRSDNLSEEHDVAHAALVASDLEASFFVEPEAAWPEPRADIADYETPAALNWLEAPNIHSRLKLTTSANYLCRVR
ncbi:MAG: hypothetical protein ACKVUS_17225 [Saprospiraceae bacterium]